MPTRPVVYKTAHRINFSDLDPYNHLRTALYSAYYVDHRMIGLREYAGWDLRTLATLPFMTWVRRMEVDFVKPVIGDQAITISCLSRCLMVVACVDKHTHRAMDWPPDARALFF